VMETGIRAFLSVKKKLISIGDCYLLEFALGMAYLFTASTTALSSIHESESL
jgi:hypothetical protein